MKNTIKFKTIQPTGKWRAFSNPDIQIIINKAHVGSIDFKSDFDKSDRKDIFASFTILKSDINSDGNPNCKWRRFMLKQRFDKVEEMKEYLETNLEIILALDLYNTDTEKLIEKFLVK